MVDLLAQTVSRFGKPPRPEGARSQARERVGVLGRLLQNGVGQVVHRSRLDRRPGTAHRALGILALSIWAAVGPRLSQPAANLYIGVNRTESTMGLLVEGVWRDDSYDTSRIKDGRFNRPTSKFRIWITPDGSPGPSGNGGFPAEAGRYH